ncbi:response regulator transcription factor [Natronohydrobacter thiooxidans]|uniref:response regulator transcription factor n=1 Tax=Natronohydrobacter thiooxidans TaxID=87172 RepID=UPI0008FF7819|nr:response regulator transcription factor [Natronohydrobacter thiooxidans]
MRLLIADDHKLLRDTLGSFLAQQEDITTVTVGDITEAQRAIATCGPFDLVLLDYGMPGMEALDGLQSILSQENAPAVVLISGMAPHEVVERALRMGIRGFLHKSMPASSTLNALRFMALGERYVPVDFMMGQAERRDTETALALPPGMRALAQSLTPRETEVLQALCHGHTNKEIARALGLSEPTIKLHVKTLYRRLGVSNRTQAAMVARSQGLC